MASSTSKPIQIVPMAGWEPNSKYGLQRADGTEAGRLVRLEDVAVWLAESLPRDRVVHELFGKLIYEGETDCLYVLSARDFALPLTLGGRANRAAAGFWQHVDFVDHDTLSEFVVREVGNSWDDCWPGLADPATDDDWYIERVIAANRERTRLAALLPDDQVPPPKFASFDTAERRAQLNRLRRLAVPMVKAHALWGWGTVATLAVDAVPASPFPLADWPALVVYRAAKTLNRRGPDFGLGNQVEIAKAELARRTAEGATESAALDAMGRELGSTANEPRKALKRALTADRMRAIKAAIKAPPTYAVTTVRSGKKAA